MRWPAWLSIYEPESWLLGLGLVAVGTAVFIWHAAQPGHTWTVAPDGQPAWLVTCSSPGDCVTECAATCPVGYHVLDRTEQRGEATTITIVGIGSGSSVGVPSTSQTYAGSLLVRCSR